MFDVFYLDKKPNLFAHEQKADSIDHARALSRTRYLWIVNYLCDYSAWDWIWEPPPWQADQRHAWGSVWQKDSGTYLIPKQGFCDTNYHVSSIPMKSDMTLWDNIDSVQQFDFSWHPDYTDPPFRYEFGTQWQKTGGPIYQMPGAVDIKYVSQSQSRARVRSDAIYLIDHSDVQAGAVLPVDLEISRTVRFFGSYRDTLIRLANSIEDHHEYVWVISSVCDYSQFDFSWHPETWQNDMLHVFASDDNKFGDTFFMPVRNFKARVQQFELLEWYDINFVPISIPRRPMPVVQHSHDSQVQAVYEHNFSAPLALFTTVPRDVAKIPAVSLWRQQTRTITPLDSGAESVIIPRDCVGMVQQQLYDYPYLDRSRRNTYPSSPLDVVFISHGESNAELNWHRLIEATAGMSNRVHRVDGITGRVAAYQAAARLSTTPWFLAVFAKLEIDADFDWSWQPDRLQQAKHYIFHAVNPVNGLIYGHQAMIAYNRDLTLINSGHGLDFTLDQPHEVVPVVSGIARFDDSAWMTWRTAFREALKLRHSLPDVENEHRLRTWLDVGWGSNGDWSRTGARDAIDYYDSVQGDFRALHQSYEWLWLINHAKMLHPDLEMPVTHTHTVDQ